LNARLIFSFKRNKVHTLSAFLVNKNSLWLIPLPYWAVKFNFSSNGDHGMKNFSILAIILSVGMALATGDAEAAKRLGGGKSSGMQRQQTTQVDKAPTAATGQTPASTAAAPAAATSTAAAAGAAAAPKRSWLGPVAGLAAGLGLAALASHLGFGEELASMLMMGLLAMAVIAVIGFVLRKRAMAQSPQATQVGGMQYAGAGDQPPATAHRGYDMSMPAGSAAGGSLIGSGIGAGVGAGLAAGTAQAKIPADFDVAGFVRNAKVQFIRLQAANDAGNVDDLREFTTPEMFAELKMDLSERGASAQKTEVVQLDANVVEVVEEAHRYIVSVRFTGQIREDTQAPEAFDELWHLTKPRTGQGGWLLSGIQQVQ
jgi:predicted lipid-binding transport protein (Tim44 family)